MNFRPTFPLTLIASIGLAGVAAADNHLTREQQSAIDARQAHMTLYSFNLGPLGAMAQDRIPYDAEVAAAAAANLAAMASLDEDSYWLEGTDSSVGGNRAKAEIWSDPEGFAAQIAKMQEATAALSAVAGDGLDAMKAAFGPVGGTCGSCHEAYRAPRS